MTAVVGEESEEISSEIGSDQPADRGGTVVAVVAARGGVGASCLTVYLAWALSMMVHRVALVDADPAGGLGLLLGTGPGPGLRWADLPQDETSFRASRLCQALPLWLGVRVLTADVRGGPAHAAAVDPVIRALARMHDLVLVDWPRTHQPPAGAHVLLLSGRDLRSAMAARIMSARAASQDVQMQLIVRDTGEDVDDQTLVRTTGCSLLGFFSTDRSIAQRTARGEDVTRGRGRARREARRLAQALVDELAALRIPHRGSGEEAH